MTILVSFKCACCQSPIDPAEDRFVKVQRGYFGPFMDQEGFVKEDENIKFEIFLCTKCFMEDPDLCAFFNRIGLRIR